MQTTKDIKTAIEAIDFSLANRRWTTRELNSLNALKAWLQDRLEDEE